MAFNSSSLALVKNYYLKGILAIYVIAFTSLYVQVQSLFGDSGVVPIRDHVAKSNKGPQELYNIILLAPKLGLSYGTFVELLSLLCILHAFTALFFRYLANSLTFGALWYVYYSICSLGQGFMSFHSDLLLLEVGFITILIAPLLPSSKLSHSDHDHLTFFLLKWITFRYFVGNVLNVYLDNDNAWYNMTAIPMVAQGVQFPSLFTWHVYNLPLEYVKLYQAYEHSVKLCAPFLFLFDLKFCRMLGFYSLLFIAIPQALFFNFGWTDLLIAVCLLAYLKDAYFYSDKRAKQTGLRTMLDISIMASYLATVGTLLVRFFGVKYVDGVLTTQVMFTPSQFKLLADHLVPVSLVVGALGLLSALYSTYFSSPKKTSILKTFAYTIVVVALFLSTFPTLIRFSPGLETKVPALSLTKNFSRFVAPYSLSNNYLVLSRVSQFYSNGRPELQIQARESADDVAWQQFDLRYKPGQPSKELSRVVPHLPRIDLRMWYAARSSLQNNQWLQTLAYRIVTREKDVLNAISPANSTPRAGQIRIARFNYKYSSKSKQPFAGYWSHFKFESEYMPVTNIENLKFVVKSNGISLAPPSRGTDDGKIDSLDKMLRRYLEISSDYIRGIDHTAFVWSLTAIAAVSMFR